MKFYHCSECNRRFTGRKKKKFCSRKCLYKSMRGDNNVAKRREVREKISVALSRKFAGSGNPFWGKQHSMETKRQISIANSGEKNFWYGKRGRLNPMYGRTGEKNPNWKGGITPVTISIRESEKYKEWRTAVFKRDNYTCRECDITKCYIEAHHIKSFGELLKENNILTLPEALAENALWNIENGKTLCTKCHEKTKTRNYKGAYITNAVL